MSTTTYEMTDVAGATTGANAAGTAATPIVMTVMGGPDARPQLTEYAALTLPAFYSAVRFLSETLASLPKSVYAKSGAIRAQVDGHPTTKLMTRKINAFTIPFVVWETWFAHAVVHGNGYLLIGRDRSQRPAWLATLNPQMVMPFRVLSGPATGQWYLIKSRDRDQVVPAADVLHLPGLGFDGMCGYPVVILMAESLQHGDAARKFGSRYLTKGTQVKGSIEIPAAATPEQIAQAKALIASYSGDQNAFTYMVLTGGATLKNTTVPPESSQLLETLNFNVTDVCRILRVAPQHVYQLDRATWGNAETMGIETVKYTLRPWIEKAEEELTAKLLTEAEQDAGQYILFTIDALLRGDAAAQSTRLQQEVNAGLRTVNEARALQDLPPDPEPASGKLRVPINFPVPGETDKPPAAEPPAAAKPARPPAKSSATSGAAALDALAPVLEAAIARVQAKTDKAFENHKDKAGQPRTIWANVFAEEQAWYVQDALNPIAAAAATLGSPTALPVATIAERYAAQIRRRAATGEGQSLAETVTAAV